MVEERLVTTIKEIRRRLKSAGRKAIGFVPTMGALHEGHFSLIRQARQENDVVVVSIFVNPLQFGPDEDFAAYPRQPAADVRAAVAAGADTIFAPPAAEIYPEPPLTRVSVEGLDQALCGRYRPGHFTGVATVVVKLLNIVGADRAYFGAKDWQQLVIVKRLAKDLDIDVEIVAVPTVREVDGLALSSRNRYLTAGQREAALVLPEAIETAAALITGGERGPAKVIDAATKLIAGRPGVRLEYFSICRPDDLTDIVDEIAGEVLIAAAVYVGDTRLIDNKVMTI